MSRESRIQEDTIAAIATAPGPAGIAIVRVSGPDSLTVADRVIQCKPPPPSKRPAGSFVHGRALAGDRSSVEEIDEVIVLVYREPHSYTREDSVEIQCHGGSASARRILRAVLNAGARLAEPGEFTRRAFLNGRIDLVQAEAVADLINARSERAAAAAVEQLEGRLSRQFNDLYEILLSAAAQVEATLDFPEEDDVPRAVKPEVLLLLQEAQAVAKRLLDTWQDGRILREGARVVICGRPNVGKSSLLNFLLGQQRAIVTDVPGTTRDTVEEETVLDGIPVRLIDTAGIREVQCVVESDGVRRAMNAAAACDVMITVVDASKDIGPQILTNGAIEYKRGSIVVANKIDLGIHPSVRSWNDATKIECSITGGQGTDDVRRAIIESLHCGTSGPSYAGISERHRRELTVALEELGQAVRLLGELTDQSVLISEHIRRSMESIGLVVGKTYTIEILDSIFSRFCIGK